MKVDGVTRTLHTKGVQPRSIQMSWRDKLLDIISNPTIAYILLMLGIYGIFFELSSPGAILPGVVGGIFLILAFYALQMLPVNYAGLALILFGIILFIAEIKVVSHGLLAVGGVISLFLGSMMLFQSPLEYMRISMSVDYPRGPGQRCLLHLCGDQGDQGAFAQNQRLAWKDSWEKLGSLRHRFPLRERFRSMESFGMSSVINRLKKEKGFRS